MSNLDAKTPAFTLPRWPGASAPFPLAKYVDRHTIGSIAIPVLLLLLWQMASTLKWLARGCFPTPVDCAMSWKRWIIGQPGGRSLDSYNGTWLPSALYSIERVVEGFAIACVI